MMHMNLLQERRPVPALDPTPSLGLDEVLTIFLVFTGTMVVIAAFLFLLR